MKAKGIVLTSSSLVADVGSIAHKMPGAVEAENLRRYSLYFDRMALASSQAFYVDLSREEKYLQKAGLLREFTVPPVSRRFGYPTYGFATSGSDTSLSAQLELFEELLRNDGGSWSIAQNQNLKVPTSYFSREASTVDVELINCLPVPSANEPLDKVLEFKAKRPGQLLRFKMAMDKLYDFIADSADPVEAEKHAKGEVFRALSDVDRLLLEEKIRTVYGSVRAHLQAFDKVAAFLEVGALASMAYGVKGAGRAVAGARLLRWTISKVPQLKVRTPNHDFAYVADTKRQFG